MQGRQHPSQGRGLSMLLCKLVCLPGLVPKRPETRDSNNSVDDRHVKSTQSWLDLVRDRVDRSKRVGRDAEPSTPSTVHTEVHNAIRSPCRIVKCIEIRCLDDVLCIVVSASSRMSIVVELVGRAMGRDALQHPFGATSAERLQARVNFYMS